MNTPEPLKRALHRKWERGGNHEWSLPLLERLKETHIIMDCFSPGDFGDGRKKTTPDLIRGGGRCVWGALGVWQWWQQWMRAVLIASQWSPGRQKVRTPSRPAQNRGWVTLASLWPPSNQSDACHDLHQPMTNLFAFRKTKPFGFDSLFQHIDQMNWTWRRISGLGTKIFTTIY